MTTLAQVSDYQSTVSDLSTVAIRDVHEVLTAVGDASPVDTRDALIAALPEVIGPYVTASSEIAAAWYEELRATAIDGGFYAVAEAVVNLAAVESLVRYGVRPLFGQSDSTVLSLLGGGVQKMVAGAGRDTVEANISRETVRVGYARIPQSGCCAFCGMVASRGPVYRSSASAGGVVGRGVDSSIALDESGKRRAGYVGGVGGGVKARGSQDIGRKYHNFCRCVAVPVFQDQTFFRPVEDKYLDMYQEAVGSDTSEYSRRDPSNAQFDAVSTKKTLANWRELFGTK